MKIFNTATDDFSALSADENHWVYNGLDAAVTREIFDEVYSVVDEVAKQTYAFSLAMQAPVLEMNTRGVLVNQNRRRKVVAEMERKLARLQSQADRMVREVFDKFGMNFNSPHQVKNLLYDVMNLPVQRKRNSNGVFAPNVDREALEKLQQYYILAEPLIAHILGIRDLVKSLGFLRTPLDADGRLRSEFQIAGTVTGRFSSSINDLGEGTNLQNITESLRSIFVADPGYKFANLDLEQGDSRNVGALCWNLFAERDEAYAGSYLNACESGDLHTIVAKMTLPFLPWGEAPDREVAETVFYRDKDYRYMCKRLGHGSNYLGKAPHMARQSKLPLQNVKDFQSSYFSAFPCIPAWHENVFWRLDNLGFLETPYGDRRFFFGRPREDATRREAVAHCPQSMTAKQINIGILNLWRANRVQLLIQVHDSILFQYREEEEAEIIPWALEALKAPLTLAKDRPFVVPTEAKVGWNWGNHSDDNPDGLVKWKGSDSRKRSETKFKLSLL